MVRQAHHPEQSRRANLKFQFSMTKTFGLRLSPFAVDIYAVRTSIVRSKSNVRLKAAVSNFEFWSLGFVCNLLFGICYFNYLKSIWLNWL